jgi:hypothetical protein
MRVGLTTTHENCYFRRSIRTFFELRYPPCVWYDTQSLSASPASQWLQYMPALNGSGVRSQCRVHSR